MRRTAFFMGLWAATNLLVVFSLLALLYGLVWEYSTREYLKGFAEAIVPLSGSPEEKAEAILSWMNEGPARRTSSASYSPSARDPEDTLAYARLLRVCGTATNAFVNLADASGLPARRLLLLDDSFKTKHVVAEVKVDGRWVVVDPSYRAMLRGPDGRLLTKEDLRQPLLFGQATRNIPGYNSIYTYKPTAHVRWPVPVRVALRGVLGSAFPRWEEQINWTLLLERKSLAFTLVAAVVFSLAFPARFSVGWYLEKRLEIPRVRLRGRALRAFRILFSQPS